MNQHGSPPSGRSAGMPYATLFKLAALATAFGIGHHIDHLLRADHLGWPLISEVTPFTYSLGIYPFIVVGLYLHARGRVGPGYWAFLTTIGALFVGLTHFGPLAVEPPEHIVGSYRSTAAGYAAVAWLTTFVLLLVGIAIYGARLWLRARLGRG